MKIVEDTLRIDCLTMKWKIQEAISEQTRGMEPEERLEHYRRQAESSPFKHLIGRNRPESKES